MAGRNREERSSSEIEIPESFLWPTPSWIRTDRFRSKPAKFTLRIVLGAIIGLLLGRVVGSMGGLFLQWLYGGLVALAGPGLERTVGQGLHWVALVLGKILSLFLVWSPLADSLAEVETTHTGAPALLLLAQIHGAVNGLFQGLRPALGDRFLGITEKVILPWGRLWFWFTYPVAVFLNKPPSRDALKAVLSDPLDRKSHKRLLSFARRGLLPRPNGQPAEWSEKETLLAFPGRQKPEKREELWWRESSFRAEVYKWVENKKERKALPLVIRGLSDPDPAARKSAVSAVAALESLETISRFVELLDDDDETMRNAAAAALRNLKNFV